MIVKMRPASIVGENTQGSWFISRHDFSLLPLIDK
jgi:hypothetical protein